MIGVLAHDRDWQIVEEFFELFKTPWERFQPGRSYEAVLTDGVAASGPLAKLVLQYGATALPSDRPNSVSVSPQPAAKLTGGEASIPLFCGAVTFSGSARPALTIDGSAVDYHIHGPGTVFRRIGYSLFDEVRYLLQQGQPADQAVTPTLEWHIELLRALLLESGVSFLEIPPRPAGHEFICCLTHDVDFFGIRRHRLDRTLAGFVTRATVGSTLDFFRGRRQLAEVVRNWWSVLSLPLVFLGVSKDIWRPFEDYEKADGTRPSTFYLVPAKNRPGEAVPNCGSVNRARAVPYQASEIGREAAAAQMKGCELAVHGIDAWADVGAGRRELEQVSAITRANAVGVRMHWLYFDNDSPNRLEAAGFDYDSTWGYNDAVGYRAGTSQAFAWPGTNTFMELPLTIMDSALFFPGRMNLSHDDALKRCRTLVANARRFGGALVLNWHERSLAPERLWGRAYGELLRTIDMTGAAWFATAAEAVAWFRWRRSVTFTRRGECIHVTAPPSPTRAAATLLIRRPEGTPSTTEERTLHENSSADLRV